MRWQEEYADPLTAVYEEARRRRDVAVLVVSAAALVLPIGGGTVLDHLGVPGAGQDPMPWTRISPGIAIAGLVASFIWAWRRMGFGLLPAATWTVIPLASLLALGLLADPWVADDSAAETVQRWSMVLAFVWLGLRMAFWDLIGVVFRADIRPALRVLAAVVPAGWFLADAGLVSHALLWPSDSLWWQLLLAGCAAIFVGGLGLRFATRNDPAWHVPQEPDPWQGLPGELAERARNLRRQSDRVVLVGGLAFVVLGIGGVAAGLLADQPATAVVVLFVAGCAAGLAAMIYAVVLDERIRALVAEHEATLGDAGRPGPGARWRRGLGL